MEKTLSTGKKVVVRESTGLDDLVAMQLIGENFDENNTFGAGMTHQAIMTLFAIESIDGEDYLPPTTLDEVFSALKNFKVKEWSEVQSLYREVNEVNLK